MLFFKPKPKTDEILPPPPPTDEELEEEFKDRNEFFDEVVQQEKSPETFPEEDEFSGLIEDLDKGAKPKKSKSKEKEDSKKRELISKKQKASKKGIGQLKKNLDNLTKGKKSPMKTKGFRSVKNHPVVSDKQVLSHSTNFPAKKIKAKSIALESGEGLNQEVLDFELPKELTASEENIELPDRVENLGENWQETEKPKEILEAEEEIKSAISKIKEQEKPSIFKRLFAKKDKDARLMEQPMPALPEADGISKIQDSIGKARQALLKFDLEAAKRSYIDIMRLYRNLKSEDQAKVYQDIKELYFERKSAEELKV